MTTRHLLTALLILFTAAPSVHSQDFYFTPATREAARPDAEGFIRRWTALEPISKMNRTNTVFTDSYLREVFSHPYFKDQMTLVPKDGDKVKVTFQRPVPQQNKTQQQQPADFRRMSAEPPKMETATEKLTWHKLDSKFYNFKLMRFGEHEIKRLYGVIYWVVTVLDCEEEMQDVRLSVGSNSASQWWLNGEDVLLLSSDRRMVADDCMSHRLTLHKGENIIRGAIINGPGLSDFCLRIVDEYGKPITGGYTIR